jgi:hypothetical protein
MANVTVTVTERAGVGGAQVVTLPLPLPRDLPGYSDSEVRVRDLRGQLMPSSARIVSSWGDGKPRWALVRVLMTLAAHERRVVTIFLGQSGPIPTVTPPEPIIATATAPPLLSAINSGLVGLAGEVKRGSSVYSLAVDTTTVVENSTLARVLRLGGSFKTDAGEVWVGGDGNDKTRPSPPRGQPLRWTLWAEAQAGMPGLRVRFRLENWGGASFHNTMWPANDTFFEALRLVLTLTKPVGKPFWVQQRHNVVAPADESKNFYYVQDGQNVAGRHSGEFACGAGTLAVRRFWQEWPKAVSLARSTATIELWPAAGQHLFVGVWSKCNDFALAPNPEATRRLLTPAAAVPAVSAMAEVWKPLGPAEVTDPDPEVREALQRHRRWVMMLVDPAASDDGITVEKIREARGSRRGGINQGIWDHYGWQDFGDIMHGGDPGDPSNLIYDYPWIAWLHHVRTNDPRLRTLAEEFTDHSKDLDQWKVFNPDGSIIDTSQVNTACGLWNWEAGGHTRGAHFGYLASTTGFGGSHTWTSGYLWGFWLTGDETYREAVLIGARGLKEQHENGFMGYKKFNWGGGFKVDDCTRCFGWSALVMNNAYRLTGDPTWLDYALKMVRNIIFMEERPWGRGGSGGKGYIPLTGPYIAPYDKNLVVATFAMYHLEPVCEVHGEAHMAGRDVRDVEDFLLRSVSWLREVKFRGGITDPSKGRIPWQISYRTDPMDPQRLNAKNPDFVNNGGELGYNPMMAGTAAYVATHILRPRGDTAKADEYLRWAKELMRDDMLYSFTQPGVVVNRSTFLNPKTRGKIGWTMNGWPAVSPKLVGWRGRAAMGLFEALSRGR